MGKFVRPTYLRIAAVDPATRTGWAMVDRKKNGAYQLIGRGVASGLDAAAVESVVTWLCVKEVKPNVVIIEDQYPGPFKVIRGLIQARTRYMHAFEAKGIPVKLVDPIRWHADLLTSRGLVDNPRPTRTDWKRAARLFVVKTFGPKAARHQDEFDAICLALWGGLYL